MALRQLVEIEQKWSENWSLGDSTCHSQPIRFITVSGDSSGMSYPTFQPDQQYSMNVALVRSCKIRPVKVPESVVPVIVVNMPLKLCEFLSQNHKKNTPRKEHPPLIFYIYATCASMFLVRGNIQKHQGMSDNLGLCPLRVNGSCFLVTLGQCQ